MIPDDFLKTFTGHLSTWIKNAIQDKQLRKRISETVHEAFTSHSDKLLVLCMEDEFAREIFKLAQGKTIDVQKLVRLGVDVSEKKQLGLCRDVIIDELRESALKLNNLFEDIAPEAGKKPDAFSNFLHSLELLSVSDTGKIVRIIEEELRKQLEIRDVQIASFQGQLERFQREPSPRAREFANQIPENADPYTLALKAIVEKKFKNARELLGQAQETKEVELSKIYEARGQTEIFAGHYADATGWYQKSLLLRPDAPELLYQTALALYCSGNIEKPNRSISVPFRS